jgi:hypothetical protein
VYFYSAVRYIGDFGPSTPKIPQMTITAFNAKKSWHPARYLYKSPVSYRCVTCKIQKLCPENFCSKFSPVNFYELMDVGTIGVRKPQKDIVRGSIREINQMLKESP